MGYFQRPQGSLRVASHIGTASATTLVLSPALVLLQVLAVRKSGRFAWVEFSTIQAAHQALQLDGEPLGTGMLKISQSKTPIHTAGWRAPVGLLCFAHHYFAGLPCGMPGVQGFAGGQGPLPAAFGPLRNAAAAGNWGLGGCDWPPPQQLANCNSAEQCSSPCNVLWKADAPVSHRSQSRHIPLAVLWASVASAQQQSAGLLLNERLMESPVACLMTHAESA